MKYIVSMRVEGRVNIEVEADSPQEAFDRANDMGLCSADLSKMEIIDDGAVNCTDEDGNLTDY